MIQVVAHRCLELYLSDLIIHWHWLARRSSPIILVVCCCCWLTWPGLLALASDIFKSKLSQVAYSPILTTSLPSRTIRVSRGSPQSLPMPMHPASSIARLPSRLRNATVDYGNKFGTRLLGMLGLACKWKLRQRWATTSPLQARCTAQYEISAEFDWRENTSYDAPKENVLAKSSVPFLYHQHQHQLHISCFLQFQLVVSRNCSLLHSSAFCSLSPFHFHFSSTHGEESSISTYLPLLHERGLQYMSATRAASLHCSKRWYPSISSRSCHRHPPRALQLQFYTIYHALAPLACHFDPTFFI